MVSALHDRLRHTLLITCVQTAFLETLQSAVRAADLDRLRQSVVHLGSLNAAEAAAVVAARLQKVPELAAARPPAADSLWPLNRNDIQTFVEHADSTGRRSPRQLIAWCRRQFDEWREGKPVPAAGVDQFLDERYEQELQQAMSRDQHVDEILAHALPLLSELELLGGARLVASTDRDIDLVAEHGGTARPRRISFCNGSGNALTRKLKRLYEEVERHGPRGLVLIRDSRRPVSSNARRAHELLTLLQQRGVPLLRPSGAAIAALDALRSLLSDAKAGDLSHDGTTIAPQTVRQWLARNLSGELQAIVDQMQSAEAVAVDDTYDAVLSALQQGHVLKLDEVVEQTSHGCDEILHCVQRHRDSIGTLDGPPVVLFERIGAD
jgi:hypothetical protein